VAQDSIPVLDFADCPLDGPIPDRFVRALGEALEDLGFVALANHGIDRALLSRAYDVAGEVFAQPEAVKRRYEDPASGRERGYTSFGVERALDGAAPDLKEFWHVGRTLPPDHAAVLAGRLHPNRFPSEVPAFGPTFRALYDSMEAFAHRLLDGVGAWLELPPAYFRDMVAEGNSVLRVIHYPDLGRPAPPGAVRAAQHEDINLITVLPASTRPGLQLLTREGDWLPVHTPPDVMICDTGDMMQLLTGGRLPSTTHRVVNPEGVGDGGRLSMPFFVHPRPDHVLTPLVEGSGQPIRAHDFLYERLQAIGVTRPAHAGASGRDTEADTAAPTEPL
jgi:isopenicillin N synthase-like dioxygenase